jgi:hypothetical protein
MEILGGGGIGLMLQRERGSMEMKSKGGEQWEWNDGI